MKALTLWPEWCWPILFLDKRVENRSWPPPKWLIGKRFALHAGKSIGGSGKHPTFGEAIRDVLYMAEEAGWHHNIKDLVRGTFLKASKGWNVDYDVEEIHRMKGAFVATAILKETKHYGPGAPEALLPPWGVEDSWHWHFGDLIILEDPVPCRGRQGLWEVPKELWEVTGVG